MKNSISTISPLFVAAAFVALLFASHPGVTHAQIPTHPSAHSRPWGPDTDRPQTSLRFIVGMPQGELSDQLGDNGYGISGALMVPMNNAPLQFGLDIGLLLFGRNGDPELGGDASGISVDRNTNLFMGHLVMRLQPQSGLFRPYADGLVGLKYMYTDTQVRNRVLPGVFDPLEASTNVDGTAFSYGVGAGFDMNLYSGSGTSRLRGIALNAGVRYLFGSEADYLKSSTIQEDGRISYETGRTKTTLLMPLVGLTMRF